METLLTTLVALCRLCIPALIMWSALRPIFMGGKRCHQKLGAEYRERIVWFAASLPRDQSVPVNEALECHIPNWKIQHYQQYPIFSSKRSARHPLIGKTNFHHAGDG